MHTGVGTTGCHTRRARGGRNRKTKTKRRLFSERHQSVTSTAPTPLCQNKTIESTGLARQSLMCAEVETMLVTSHEILDFSADLGACEPKFGPGPGVRGFTSSF